MKQTLPDNVFNAIIDRFNEVIDDLIDTSQMIDRSGDRFDNWCQVFVSNCVQYQFGKEAIKEPRHPKGLIAELKKQRKKLHEVRNSLATLPEPYIKSTWFNNFSFESLEEFSDLFVSGFMEPMSGIHNFLSYASVSLSMLIARAIRESPNDRRNSPKTNFAEEIIYLFQRANHNNEINSSPASSFADFFSLAYYVTTGEDGVFLERPVKTAIANIRSTNGQIMHPDLYAQYAPEEIKKQIEKVWPDQVAEIKQFEASYSLENSEWLNGEFNRNQIQDAKWALKNFTDHADMDSHILHKLIEAGLRALKSPTDNECKEILEYDLSRARTSPPTENG